MKRVPRGPALLVLALALVIGGLADRDARSSTSGTTVATMAPAPAAAPASARSSAWYCTGTTAAPNTVADGSVVVANAGNRPLTGAMIVIPGGGVPAGVPLQIAPASRQVVRLADVAPAPFASVIVELDGGEAVAELTSTGPLGDSVSRCASAASDRWYFADGVTTRDATETLYLFNPFPDDAIVDLAFSTEEGQVRPESLTGLSVAGRGTVPVAVGDFVQRRDTVSTAITARSGRLVVARLQTFDGSAGRKGVTMGLGAAAPSPVWYFPEGRVAEGLTERYQIFNPQKEEARVELELDLEQGAAEPILITVPPESRVTVIANDEARIPKEVSHAVTVRTINNVPVVAERSTDAQQAGRSGVSFMIGGRSPARRWALAAGAADDSVQQWLVFQNPGTAVAAVSVTLLADGTPQPVEGLQSLEVAPGGRRAVRVNETLTRGATPLVVEATQPIVLEQDLYRSKGLGMAMNIGVQLRD